MSNPDVILWVLPDGVNVKAEGNTTHARQTLAALYGTVLPIFVTAEIPSLLNNLKNHELTHTYKAKKS